MNASRIVIVTGAAAGIGLATARAFAAAGDTVVLTDLDAVDGRGARGRARRSSCRAGDGRVRRGGGGRHDRRDADAVRADRRADQQCRDRRCQRQPACSTSRSREVRRLIAVNLDGIVSSPRARPGGSCCEQGSGSIVNLSSGAALSALPGRTPYSMTKAAILGLDARAGVRMGRARRPRQRRAARLCPHRNPRLARTRGQVRPERRRRRGAARANGRTGGDRRRDPHVAGARYVTGAAFLADGGVAAYGGRAAASSAPVSGRIGDGVVLVTGGASGIGAAIADHFVALGANVVVPTSMHARSPRCPPTAPGSAIDVTDEDAVETAVQPDRRRRPGRSRCSSTPPASPTRSPTRSTRRSPISAACSTST